MNKYCIGHNVDPAINFTLRSWLLALLLMWSLLSGLHAIMTEMYLMQPL